MRRVTAFGRRWASGISADVGGTGADAARLDRAAIPTDASQPSSTSGTPGLGRWSSKYLSRAALKPKGLSPESGTAFTIAGYAQPEHYEVKRQQSNLLPRRMEWWMKVEHGGDIWQCYSCDEYNPTATSKCEGCGRIRRRAYWVCGSCLYPNRTQSRQGHAPVWPLCSNCGESYGHRLPHLFHSGDWICKPCKEVVAPNEMCPSCQQPAKGENDFYPMERAGNWQCSSCRLWNFKTNTKCRHCGFWK
eukprot:Sspe_Gene.29733::Locus_14293_Transcript_1_1_Confidence_1.000_Length_921::g.29733::m.29733